MDRKVRKPKNHKMSILKRRIISSNFKYRLQLFLFFELFDLWPISGTRKISFLVFNFFNFSESSVSKQIFIYRVSHENMRFERQNDEDQLSFEEILFVNGGKVEIKC